MLEQADVEMVRHREGIDIFSPANLCTQKVLVVVIFTSELVEFFKLFGKFRIDS